MTDRKYFWSSTGDLLWTWGGSGLPRIPNRILESVVYLYPSQQTAQAGRGAGGTGFLIEVGAGQTRLAELSRSTTLYFVTNRHVVAPDRGTPALVVRMNTQEGATAIIPTSPAGWIYGPKDDVAIYPIGGLDARQYKFGAVPASTFLMRNDFYSIWAGPGDEVFFVGRFVRHEGVQRNTPTVRFGNISMMPFEPVDTASGPQEAYLVEARSWAGYSGSPVFTYSPEIQVEVDQRLDYSDATAEWSGVTEIHLLGVDCGHFNTGYGDNSGMMVVVPAWAIWELLMRDEVREDREKEMERLDRENEERRKKIVQPDKDEPVPTKEDFFRDLEKAASRTPTSDWQPPKRQRRPKS
jgi:hypothetical protein